MRVIIALTDAARNWHNSPLFDRLGHCWTQVRSTRTMSWT